jgi:hypothetical protein
MHPSSELPSKQTAFATQPPIIPAYQRLLKPLHAAENEKDKKKEDVTLAFNRKMGC